ncbi:hypothetical protein LPB86_02110 [Pedobacter sp. MC2016-14]|uniref:hypothetical protein n=1 Tax=Pedobacter sp. MC2016-14 TaxID=2897327 RepID=UPI001E2DFCCB|nr:hypothetical protein [Pedobacter sp. MC2016-14]MCD0487005.1 hypothetical protein [Pedobacter sp. MC2016-14]
MSLEKSVKGSKRKIWIWVGSIVAVLLVLVGAAALYLSAKWKPLLTEKIQTAVYEGSKHLYRIDFKDIHLNLLTGSARIDSVRFMPDTAVFNRLKQIKQAPTHLFQIKLAHLQFSRIGILKAYFKKRVEMNAIVLDQPSINVIYNKVSKKPDTVKDKKTLYEQISKSLKSVHIKSIQILDADFDYINGATSKTLNSVKHLNVNVKDLLIDSLSQYDTSRFYLTKDITFELAGYRSLSKNKMYTTKVDTIKGSAAAKNLEITGLQMIPMYPDLKFSRMQKVQKDRYDLLFRKIELSGVDFILLNTEGNLHASSLKIGPATVKIFMNRELPPTTQNKGSNFPHMALRKLPLPAIIDTLKLQNVDVAYTEYDPIAQKRGTIEFDQLSGNILNVTNDSLKLSVNNHAVANLHTLLQKKINVNVAINFNLTAPNGAFSYSGTMGAFDMKTLNPIAKALGLIEINSGKVNKVAFDIQGNTSGSKGLVQFNYTDLNIKLLKAGEEGEPVKKKGLLSFLANALVVKNDNPDKNKPARTANITFVRPPSASFFNLMWKSVYLGIREIVGIGIVPVKTPQQKQEQVEDKLEERKQKRAEKREEKEKKRREAKEKKE